MSTDGKLWHLYCVKTQERLSDLTEEAALTRVKILPDNEWPDWIVWTEGYADWIPLPQCANFKKSRDRRRYPRVEIRVIVTIIVGFQKFQTFSRDISVGGILLDREVPFKPMTDKIRVSLKYADLSGQAIEFGARLIMDRERPIRLEFLSAEERFRKRLYEWVDRALQRKKEDEAA